MSDEVSPGFGQQHHVVLLHQDAADLGHAGDFPLHSALVLTAIKEEASGPGTVRWGP